MDKYEFNIKIEQIKKLVSKNDYDTAMKIADTIDWRRVRNTNLLSMVAMVYEKNEEYQEAKEILLQAFERAPIGKRLLFKLAELALKVGNIEEAEAYYREFGDLASDDSRQQLLRFMILKAKGAPAQQLIHSLESYTSVELDEKWLYELAELYSLADMHDRCVDTCDRIMLMFGLGKYVEKAMDLKIRYAPLSNYQMDLVENRDKYEAKLRAVEQQYGTGRQKEEPAEEYYEEEPMPEQVPENPIEDNLAARMQEAAVQENLAREMSRISYEKPVIREESNIEHTRVLEDIRRLGHPMAAVPVPKGMYKPDLEVPEVEFSEPVFEEEEPEEPGLEESGIGYGEVEIPYESYDNDYEDSGYAGHQYAATSEEPEELPEEPYYDWVEEPEQAYEPSDTTDRGTGDKDCEYDSPEISEAADMEFEDLYEDEELPVRNHLMIEARTPEKGLQIAVDALKQIHKESGIKNPVAKISGSKLSIRGVLASADRLAGKDLVIEEAGDLTPEALDELNKLMDRDKSSMIVVLIDNPKQMETLHREHSVLASKFECIGSGEEPEGHVKENASVKIPERGPERKVKVFKAPVKEMPAPANDEIPENFYEGYPEGDFNDAENTWQDDSDREDGYEEDDFYEEDYEDSPSVRDEEGPGFHGEEMDIDEFAQYACRYANEIDCSITGKSMLALYERIEIMEEDGVSLNRASAEGLIEEAADRAEKPSFGKKIKNLFSTKYDKDGLLILKEEHFIY